MQLRFAFVNGDYYKRNKSHSYYRYTTVLKIKNMKNLTLLAVLLLGFASFAQIPSETSKFYLSYKEQPLLVINDDIIASVEVLRNVKTDNLTKLDISKDGVLSQTSLFPMDKKTKGSFGEI